jgi:hypothetical protein
MKYFMARRVFYSFHYKPDGWRVWQVRNMGVIEGSRLLTGNEWETIKCGGNQAIERWINEQMSGTSCLVVLIGQDTANRKWVNYEIKKAWNEGRGVLGLYINKLEDQYNRQSLKGNNPLDYIQLENKSTQLSWFVKTYDPPLYGSKNVYNYIRNNLTIWVEEAISIRKKY